MGQNGKKNLGTVIYASETIQNCKNPTGHIDTLRTPPSKILWGNVKMFLLNFKWFNKIADMAMHVFFY